MGFIYSKADGSFCSPLSLPLSKSGRNDEGNAVIANAFCVHLTQFF